jgi:hypothetical protein
MDIWIAVFSFICSFVINHFINDYRIKKIESELTTFKNISERLARIEGKIDYITQKNV